MTALRLAHSDSRTPTRALRDALAELARSLSLLLFGLAILSQETRGQTFVGETALPGFVPFDVDITPNGNLVVVRSCDGSGTGAGASGPNTITIWEAATGSQRLLQMGQGVNEYGNGSPLAPSDLIAVSNDRAVVIGSDEIPPFTFWTYIDVINLGLDQPVVFKHHEIGTSTSGGTGGNAHDVAVTRNGKYAVVNFRGGIRVIDLYGDGGSIPAGGIALAQDDPNIEPRDAMDSVEVTNSRAIVVNRKLPTVTNLHTFVTIINLDTSPPSHIVTSSMTGTGAGFYEPHDVTITPDGAMAVVASGGAIGLYNLQSGAQIGPTIYDGLSRFYRVQVDSVVASNDRAVVIGSHWGSGDYWTVSVYSLHRANGMTLLREWTDPDVFSQDAPHDVAISPDYGKAAIKTRFSNLIVNNLPALSGPVQSNELSDIASNGDPMFDSGVPRLGTFVSDSVDLTGHWMVPVQPGGGDGQRQFAFFIGAYRPSPQAPLAASIEIVDLVPIPALPAAFWPIADALYKTVPADLNRQLRLLVRFNAPPDELSDQNANGRDFRQFAIDPLAMLGDVGGRGSVFALDSLVSSTTRAVSVAESFNPQQPLLQESYVHFVNTQ